MALDSAGQSAGDRPPSTPPPCCYEPFITTLYTNLSMANPSFVGGGARTFLDTRGTTAALAPNGLNPATIMEKAVRDRITNSYFYQEQCFFANEADMVDRAVEYVNFIGGTHGADQKPSPFLCLAFKLLELAPSEDIVAEYLAYGGERFKYLRALACFYVRLTRPAAEVYRLLEPFLEDRRKLRRRRRDGCFLSFVDEFVDDLLTKERVCATSLWKMPARETLEDAEVLEPRVSPLGDLDALLEEDSGGDREENGHEDTDEDEDMVGAGDEDQALNAKAASET
ncbi:hypothetical protein XA68_13102 [Ophiocordyceps unilateralis]|uniref:Pre-mRNA-splicing factor 38 n=1 Tax=Ophiocordyceps unilateralis TaxID=268505 RepID=A0A2A9PCB9_OPHUN|nr:hypothetical protein XA68_13102 [Ophiocordyceps unilateralis]